MTYIVAAKESGKLGRSVTTFLTEEQARADAEQRAKNGNQTAYCVYKLIGTVRPVHQVEWEEPAEFTEPDTADDFLFAEDGPPRAPFKAHSAHEEDDDDEF